jgi:hypothetical protein
MNESQNSTLKWSQDVVHTFSQWISQGTIAKLTRVALFCLISLLWHLYCLWWPKSCVWDRSMNGGGWDGLNMLTIWLGMFLGLPHLEMAGWGGIYSHQPSCSRWGRLLAMGAPDSPVPHQIGTVHCLVCLWLYALTLPRTVPRVRYFCSRPLREVAVAPLAHRTVRWHTGQFDDF